jgi:transcriptional regulator with AAA-type ATPase domain
VGENICLTPEIEHDILNYSWPGNIRELKNAADYFKLMKNVNIILDYTEIKELKQDQLSNYIFPADRNALLALLNILLSHSRRNEGIGRNKLLVELRKVRESISENKLEKVLLYLKNQEYIIREKGRAGVKLTDKGFDFYKEIVNS